MDSQSSLSDRYYHGLTYGQTPITSPELAGAEKVSREKRLQTTLDYQLAIQKRTLEEFRYSNVEVSETITTSIEDQTGRLESAIETSTNSIIEGIAMGAFEICSSLGAIEWQIQQTNDLLTQSLQVLRENRSNEARQLVDQGIRHLVVGEFKEAEERFLRALDYDSTDFQILINLGQVAIEKGDSADAKKYFKKATVLPANLSAECKAIGFRHLARLDYADESFSDAFSFQKLVCDLPVSTVKDIYLNGVYHLLSGEVTTGLKLIEKSIRIDPAFYPISATDPDLVFHQDKIFSLLTRLETQAKGRNATAEKELDYQIDLLEETKNQRSWVHLNEIQTLKTRFHVLAKRGVYKEICCSSIGMEELAKVATTAKIVIKKSHKLQKAESEASRWRARVPQKFLEKEGVISSRMLWELLPFFLYPTGFIYMFYAAGNGGSGFFGSLFVAATWPLWLLLGFFLDGGDNMVTIPLLILALNIPGFLVIGVLRMLEAGQIEDHGKWKEACKSADKISVRLDNAKKTASEGLASARKCLNSIKESRVVSKN